MNRKTQRIHQTISLIMLIAMIGHVLLVPTAVNAQQLNTTESPVARRSEQLFTAAPEAMSHALALGQMMTDINATNTADLTEETLITAKEQALQTAEKAAVAQGALDAIVYSVAQGDYQLQTATDMDAQLGTLATTEFVSETVDALAAAGLTSAEIDQLANSPTEKFQVRRDIEQHGLDAETEAFLTSAGLTTAQIEGIETDVASYGLADSTLPTRLNQLEAAAAEMRLVRSQALTAYAQLLTRHVIWQQLNGVSARSLSQADLEMLAEDQIRLLTHISYLENLSPDNPNPDLGEGQWLFVERYSSQAVTHIDTLIMETHNLGLIVDLYVMLGVHATAQAAQAGGANLAAEEITMWGDVLAGMMGDDLPEGQQARHAVPPMTMRIAAAITQFSGYDAFTLFAEPETEIAEPAVILATQKMKGRMSRVATVPLAAGSVTELNETNNEARIHFYATGITPFPPIMQQLLLPYMPHLGGILDSFLGVLLGQTENPWEIGGNIILSFVPVLGEVMDILVLLFVPHNWEKAFAAIGLVASIVSDLAEILTVFASLLPPAGVAVLVGGAVPAEGADVGAAILKNLPNLVGGTLKKIIHSIPFSDALKLGLQSIINMVKQAVKVIGTVDNWPTSLNGVIDLMNSVKTRVTDPFLALLTRFSDNLSKLYQLGFGDGGFLLGRILKNSDEALTYSDETLEAIARISDDVLGETASELSDEAAHGLGKIVDDIGESDTRRFLTEMPCNIAQHPPDKSIHLGKVVSSQELCSDIRDRILTIVGKSSQDWTSESINGLSKMTNDIGIEGIESLASRYSDEVFEQTFQVIRTTSDLWTPEGVEGVAKITNRFDQGLAKEVLDRQGRGKWGNQVFSWLYTLDETPAFNGDTVRSWVQGLAAGDRRNYIGNVFELKVAAEDLASRGLKEINHYESGKKGVDFILDDGTIVEVKNRQMIDQSVYEQFQRFVGVSYEEGVPIAVDARYSNSRMEYVFRGPRNEVAENNLKSIAEDANSLNKLSDNNLQYFKENIRWLNLDDFPPAGS